MSFRKATNEDYERVIELYSEFTNEEYNLQENDFTEFLDKTTSKIYVVENLEGNVIGCATIFIERKLIHNKSSVAHIEDVVVSEKFRGQGYGKILIRGLVRVAEENQCYKIILNCTNEVRPFYETCGFREKGLQMAIYLNEQ